MSRIESFNLTTFRPGALLPDNLPPRAIQGLNPRDLTRYSQVLLGMVDRISREIPSQSFLSDLESLTLHAKADQTPIGKILQQAEMDTAATLKAWRSIMQTHLVDKILSPGTLEEISEICNPKTLQGIKNAAFLWAFGGEDNPQKDDIANITNIDYGATSIEGMMRNSKLTHSVLESLANYPTALVTPSPNSDGTWTIQDTVLSDSQAFTSTPSDDQVFGFQTLMTYLQNGALSVNSPGFKTRRGLTSTTLEDDQESNSTAGSAYFLPQSTINAAQANIMEQQAVKLLRRASEKYYASYGDNSV